MVRDTRPSLCSGLAPHHERLFPSHILPVRRSSLNVEGRRACGPSRRTKSGAAFTLIELLLTLSILLIIVTIGIPHFLNRDQFLLQHELEKLEVVCTYLQQKAAASNQKQTLIFDPQANSYWYIKNSKKIINPLATPLIFGFLNNAQGPPSQPTKPITQPITFGVDETTGALQAIFLPNGQISPGTVYLIDKHKKIMGALTCPISQVSYIRRYLYQNSHNQNSTGRGWIEQKA